MDKPVEVTQEDRDAAADFLEAWEPGPEMTVVKLARAFAAHRQLGYDQAVRDVVAWVRRLEIPGTDWPHYLANAIERGEFKP